MIYAIEKGIPIPDVNWHRRRDRANLPVFQFDRMKVGDSFKVPAGHEVTRMRSASVKYTIENPKIVFTTRSLPEGGARIWRIK